MALPNISIGDLKKKNDASQAARTAEKSESGSNGQQKKGR